MWQRLYQHEQCPVARTLEIVGERWTLLIIRDALAGATRFGQFRHQMAITASVLASRLEALISDGVMYRQRYHEHPTRYEYHLTPKGRELALVVGSLRSWADEHLDAGPGHLATHHVGCGGQVEARLVCLHCLEPVSAAQTVTARSPAPAVGPLDPPSGR